LTNIELLIKILDLKQLFMNLKSTSTRRAGGLNFPAKGGGSQKHGCAFNGALATGYKASGL
jgi:hypothetical protein